MLDDNRDFFWDDETGVIVFGTEGSDGEILPGAAVLTEFEDPEFGAAVCRALSRSCAEGGRYSAKIAAVDMLCLAGGILRSVLDPNSDTVEGMPHTLSSLGTAIDSLGTVVANTPDPVKLKKAS